MFAKKKSRDGAAWRSFRPEFCAHWASGVVAAASAQTPKMNPWGFVMGYMKGHLCMFLAEILAHLYRCCTCTKNQITLI